MRDKEEKKDLLRVLLDNYQSHTHARAENLMLMEMRMGGNKSIEIHCSFYVLDLNQTIKMPELKFPLCGIPSDLLTMTSCLPNEGANNYPFLSKCKWKRQNGQLMVLSMLYVSPHIFA